MSETGEISESVRVQELENQLEQLTLQLHDYHTVKQQLAQVQKRGAPVSVSGNTGGGEVILFVEDEEAVMRIGKLFLESYGYTVLTAGDCEKGLSSYRNNSVDLVVMDVGLPGMGGAGFLRGLQSIDSEVKVLAISGYPASSERIKALNLKEQEFLQKPFSREDLTRRVRIILDGAI